MHYARTAPSLPGRRQPDVLRAIFTGMRGSMAIHDVNTTPPNREPDVGTLQVRAFLSASPP